MFENYGSCFAAEQFAAEQFAAKQFAAKQFAAKQFADIKLGAKYLLTLTTFISQHVIYNFIYFGMPFVLGG